MKLLKTLIACLVLLIGLKLEAQDQNKVKIQESLQASIDKMAEDFLKDSLMKSITIGIYYKGEKFSSHYGELDEGKNNRPSDETIYDIGSVTKTFLGTLMAQAELDGKLSIEDDVRKYLDGEYPNLQYEAKPIKIRHLLTHTSRLPRWLPLRIQDEFNEINADLPNRIAQIESTYSKQAFLEDLKKVEIDTTPGIGYNYSNAGAELASYILEKAYKMPFEKVLEEKLFRQANMNSSAISLSKKQQKMYANGYGDYNNLTPAMKSYLWGGGGHGKSTVSDLLNYIEYHLSKQAAVSKSHETLYDKEIIHGDPRNKIAYFWENNIDGDFGPYIKHHGGAFGVQNWLLIYPEEQMGISVITNQSGFRTPRKLRYVANRILNEFAKIKYATDKSETEQITETLMDYIEGSTKGQPKRLEKAFHPDLNLYYIWAREFRVWSGKDYIKDTKEGEPTGEIGEILSIDYENDIATAKIRISHPQSTVPYIDYLMLIKMNGSWKIVHKMFTQEKKK